MRIPYTAHIEDQGVTLAYDVDFELELDAKLDGGALDIDVTGVFLDGTDLMASKSPLSRIIGCNIAEKAQTDDYVIDRVMEEAGIHYVGLGGNDPDGRLVRRRGVVSLEEREDA